MATQRHTGAYSLEDRKSNNGNVCFHCFKRLTRCSIHYILSTPLQKSTFRPKAQSAIRRVPYDTAAAETLRRDIYRLDSENGHRRLGIYWKKSYTRCSRSGRAIERLRTASRTRKELQKVHI
jgi:hypothetical protein